MLTNSLNSLFYIDALSKIMISMIIFVGAVIAFFARRYLLGDSHYRQFFQTLGLLILSLIVMATANHLLLYLVSCGFSNLLLVRLIIHKSQWQAAKASGYLAAKTLFLGFAALGLAFILLYSSTGLSSIQAIVTNSVSSPAILILTLLLIMIAAMTQSAIWPFHRWLLSSLNSPTPVSAFMHAGLVNGGGFLLARFAPLYFSQPTILTLVFGLGLMSALIGTLWKLMQNDIKKMLACSTMSQMGFMLVQCGLGLFPAAMAHLCWHGLFKANLFLNSGSAAQEKRFSGNAQPKIIHFIFALFAGLLGSYVFALISHKNFFCGDTTLLLIAVSFIAATQFSLVLINYLGVAYLPFVLLIAAITGGIYGLSVDMFNNLLSPLNMMNPQPLNSIYIVGLGLLLTCWLLMQFQCSLGKLKCLKNITLKYYVKMLNASQPHPSTVTAIRNEYQY